MEDYSYHSYRLLNNRDVMKTAKQWLQTLQYGKWYEVTTKLKRSGWHFTNRYKVGEIDFERCFVNDEDPEETYVLSGDAKVVSVIFLSDADEPISE